MIYKDTERHYMTTKNKIDNKKAFEKFEAAAQLLEGSRGEIGIFAGSGERYWNQYWTRDFALALAPAIMDYFPRSERLSRKRITGLVDEHLDELASRQGKSGAIPILFADFPELVLRKLKKAVYKDGRLDLGKSFVAQRIFAGLLGDKDKFPEFADFGNDEQRGLYRLTPGTTDSELMFAYAVYSMGARRFFPQADKAVAYLEANYMKDGLHHGADWRDTMEVFFRDKPLLSNNAILHTVYQMQGAYEKAGALNKKVHQLLWDSGRQTYLDYPGATRFDPLGGALGVLCGLIPTENYRYVIRGFKSVDTTQGVTIQCKHNPYLLGEREVIERTGGVVVWPFVVGFTVLAALKIGADEFALDQFNKFVRLDGFGEWYDPADGNKWGEFEQGWSAALYIRAFQALARKGLLQGD